jgi:hypothetical protein
MRKWCIAAAIVAVCGGLAAVPILAQEKEKGDRDNARIERELESLEAQREKIDARIRDLRRQMGRRDNDVRVETRSRNLKDLSPEQRKEVEKAIEDAHRAVRESLKNLPDIDAHVKAFAIPDIKEHMKVFALPDGKFENMSPEEQKKFELHMKEFGEKMGRMGEEMAKKFQNFKFDFDGSDMKVLKGDGPSPRILRIPRDGKDQPEIRVLRPRRGGSDDDTQREIEELRRELRELREEMRKSRGGKTTGTESVFDL